MFHLHKKKKDNKGFTLVELVVVIAILAILVGLLVPQYTKYVERSRKSADASNLENMVRAVEITAADASDSIPAGTYKIEMSTEDDVNVTVTGAASGVDASSVKTALEKVLGTGYINTHLKSKKWNELGATDGKISATIEIGPEGETTLKYSPAELKELVNNFNKKTTPAPTP